MDTSPPPRGKRGFIEALGAATSNIAARAVPEPFVLAVALSFLTILLGVFFGQDVADLPMAERLKTVAFEGWYGGLFGSGGLAFTFQMVLILVTGHALALSPPVRRIIDVIARIPKNAAQASAVVALFSCGAAVIHWGLGVVAGAMLAREIGRAWAHQKRSLHYPLLGAAAYTSFLVWHGGFSGTAPLKVSEDGHFLADITGVISTGETLFSPMNIVITGCLILLCVALFYLLTPKDEAQHIPYSPLIHGGGEAPDLESSDDIDGEMPQLKGVRVLERSPLVPVALAILTAGVLINLFMAKGLKALDLNLVNLTFFSLGLLLHGSPRTYLTAAADGARGAAGIVLQFPLYFGILGMLKASGLITQLSEVFVAVASDTTLPVLIYLSAGIVNLFVPSGGGQWAIQGEIMMSAAKSLGVPPAKAVMALAYGDAWTNMLQPFWALPLLGITGLRARDIVGYTTLIFLGAGPLTIAWLLIF